MKSSSPPKSQRADTYKYSKVDVNSDITYTMRTGLTKRFGKAQSRQERENALARRNHKAIQQSEKRSALGKRNSIATRLPINKLSIKCLKAFSFPSLSLIRLSRSTLSNITIRV